MKRFIFIFFVFLIYLPYSLAQNQDSLASISYLESIDFSSTQSLSELKEYFRKNRSKPDANTRINYGLKGAKAALKLGNDSLYVDLMIENVSSVYSVQLFRPEKSEEYLEEIKPALERLESTGHWTKWYSGKAVNYQIKNDLVKALEMFGVVIENFKKEKKYNAVIAVLYNVANIYYNLGDQASAIKYSREALRFNQYLSEEEANLNSASVNFRISFNYRALGQPDSLKFYLYKSLDAIQQVNDFNISPNGAQIFCEVYLSALTHLPLIKDDYSIDSIYKKASSCSGFNQPFYSLAMLEYYQHRQDFDKVDAILSDSSLINLIPIGDREILLYKVDNEERKNNYKNAFAYLKEYSNLSSELMQQEKIVYSSYFDSKYEAAKKEEEIKLLTEVKENEKLRNRNLLISLLFVLSLLGLGLFFYLRLRKSAETIKMQAAELKRAEAMKSKLFTNIAHELRTPLTLISSPIHDILREESLSEKGRERLLSASNNSEKLLFLSNQIMDLTKSQSVELPLRLHRFSWQGFMENLRSEFKPRVPEKGFSFDLSNSVSPDLFIQSDFDKLKIIAENLLQNALKFNSSGGSITLTSEESPEYILFQVKDEGSGIHPDDLPHVFDRYFQSKINTAPEGGFGIGLAVCKEYIERMGGSISIDSELGSGTIVSLRIPKIIDSSKEVPSLDISSDKKTGLTFRPSEREYVYEVTTEPFSLLIVEDNDDLRSYLVSAFQDKYKVSTAPNGLKALQLLDTFQPSLIITDWMMPEMNGLELVKQIRKKEETYDIPVLMLTARSLDVDAWKALQVGVDDYLIKPFETEVLRSRVRYLLSKSLDRKECEKQNALEFSEEVSDKHSGGPLSAKDKEWIGVLETAIQDNLGVFDLTVSDIADRLEISKSQVNRKTRMLLGMSAMQFIDEVRFWEARRLLEEGELKNVKTAAYSVGLKSVKNFSRNFKKRFGVYPSDLL